MKIDITDTFSNTGYARMSQETTYPVNKKSLLSLHHIKEKLIVHYVTDPADKYVVYDLRTKTYDQIPYINLDWNYHLIYIQKGWWYIRKFAYILPRKGVKKNES